MESTKRLIVAADDFGLTNRVNEAIAIACREGIVTSASLLVNATGFESAVEIARRYTKLDLGLHLNLTEGRPITDASAVSSIAGPTGFLYKHPLKLGAALLARRIRSADLEREIRAQIEKACASGLEITHIDGHKHVHAMPAVLRILFRVAPEYGIHALRAPGERMPRLASMLNRNKQSWKQVIKQYAFGKGLSAAWRMSGQPKGQPGLATPKRFYGVTQTGFFDLNAFRDVVEDIDDGIHELMCHPGYVDDDLNNTPTRLRAQRERELELLTGSEVRVVLRKAGVSLVGYKALVENYGNRRPDPILHRCSSL